MTPLKHIRRFATGSAPDYTVHVIAYTHKTVYVIAYLRRCVFDILYYFLCFYLMILNKFLLVSEW